MPPPRQEVNNICKILGLQFNKQYTDTRSLRYGHVMIMADQDHDGSHIKGLVINFLHYFWPSLLKCDTEFVQQFITPIVKATKVGSCAWSCRHEGFNVTPSGCCYPLCGRHTGQENCELLHHARVRSVEGEHQQWPRLGYSVLQRFVAV